MHTHTRTIHNTHTHTIIVHRRFGGKCRWNGKDAARCTREDRYTLVTTRYEKGRMNMHVQIRARVYVIP